MRRAFGLAMVLTSLMMLSSLFFQNCSVHKSSDKKEFDESGVATGQQMQTSSSTIDSASTTGTSLAFSSDSNLATLSENGPDSTNSFVRQEQPDCRPYMNEAEADSIFEQPVESKMYFDAERQEEICLVSTLEDSDSGLDTAVCSIAAKHLSTLHSPPHSAIPDPLEDMLGLGGFGLIEREGTPQLIFVGAEEGAVRGVQCRMTFVNKKQLDQSQKVALDRAARLVHAIARGTKL